MLCVIEYLFAIRRLQEANKTIKVLGGEHSVHVQMLAQRDFIKHELEYYKEKSKKFAYVSIGTCLIVYNLYLIYIIWGFNFV